MWPLADGPQADTVILLHALEEFAGQFAALRELAEHVAVHLRPLDDAEFDNRIQRATTGSLEGLPDAQRERIARLGMSWMETLQKLPQEEFGAGFGIPVASAAGHAQLANAQQAFNEMIEAYPDIEHGGTFVIGFLDAPQRSDAPRDHHRGCRRLRGAHARARHRADASRTGPRERAPAARHDPKAVARWLPVVGSVVSHLPRRLAPRAEPTSR
jgi:hypothetical protein